MPLSSSVHRSLLRAFMALPLLALAACPTETLAPGSSTKLGPLYGEELKAHVPGDIVAVTVWIVAPASARDFDNPVTLAGADVDFSVADPTIARISGPSRVTTAQADFFHRAQAVAQLEYLREGTTTLTARVANATWTDPDPLPGTGAGPFPVSGSFPVKSVRPDHIAFSPASPIFIESRLESLEVSAQLVSTTGEQLLGYSLKWSCPQGETVSRLVLHSGGECTGSDLSVKLFPTGIGTTVFHATAPDPMFARYPVSGDLQLTVTNPVARIDLTATGLVRIGSATALTPAFRDAQGNLLPANLALVSPSLSSNWRLADRLAWTSSDPSVATVDNSGAVTGVAPAAVTITATYYQLDANLLPIGTFATGSLTLNVQPTSNLIVVEPNPAMVTVGGAMLLRGTATDAAGHPIGATFTWLTQNTALLSATDQGFALGANLGRITGLSTGVPSTTPSATVDVWVRAAGAQIVVPVTVYRTVATALITPATYTLHPGEHVQLAATLQDDSGNTVPNAATSIDWTALDPGTATVSALGLVTAIAVNATPARIRVQSTDGSTTLANITVQPLNPNPIATLQLQPSSASMAIGTVATPFTAQALDAAGVATSAPVSWAINTSAVGNIGPTGQITALGAGSSTIVASNASGSVYGQALLRVAGPSGIARIVVQPSHVFLTNPGDTSPYTVTAFDVNGVQVSPGPVTWTSANLARATVDLNTGVVTAVATGGTWITATRDGQTSTAAVTIGARGAIKGTLSSTSNQFLSGGKVSINGNPLVNVDAGTNQFYIPGLGAGSYLISVSVDGIPGTRDFTVVVTANSVTTMPVAVFP